eukprot:scaffold24875_cov135-Skeletonema_menzelii.AAC.1
MSQAQARHVISIPIRKSSARLASTKLKFVHEEALPCELAAYYLDVGDTENAIQHFLLAHEKYHEWERLGSATVCLSLFNPDSVICQRCRKPLKQTIVHSKLKSHYQVNVLKKELMSRREQ